MLTCGFLIDITYTATDILDKLYSKVVVRSGLFLVHEMSLSRDENALYVPSYYSLVPKYLEIRLG